jgi:hypothetical protein
MAQTAAPLLGRCGAAQNYNRGMNSGKGKKTMIV